MLGEAITQETWLLVKICSSQIQAETSTLKKVAGLGKDHVSDPCDLLLNSGLSEN